MGSNECYSLSDEMARSASCCRPTLVEVNSDDNGGKNGRIEYWNEEHKGSVLSPILLIAAIHQAIF